MFITLDGGDGCGKSTQIRHLAERFTKQGHSVVLCRDPGTTPLGDAVRDILLNKKGLAIADITELLLFSAARAQLVREIIQPALASGQIVLSDRFLASTYAYQCYAGGVSEEVFSLVCAAAVGSVLPDLGIILDISYEVAVRRIGHRAVPDRMESKGEDYHRQVREGFLRYAAAEPERYSVIDAALSPDDVAELVWSRISPNITAHDVNVNTC